MTTREQTSRDEITREQATRDEMTREPATRGQAGEAPRARSAETTAPSGAGPELTYVYAVGRDDAALRRTAAALTGVDGHALRIVGAEGLAALVSAVPADVFGEQALRAQLEDLARLEAIARAHHAVVVAAFAETVVLPLRLATVYRDEARVLAMLTDQHRRFGELLAGLDGHVELGVKVYADPGAVPPPVDPPAPAASGGGSGPGRAYLAQRRARRRTTQDLYRAAGDVAAEAARVAEGLARARAVHRPQQGELSGHRGENLSNEAYLVPAESVSRFQEYVGALDGRTAGVHVEVTGPWAPYSFATPDGVGGDAGSDGTAGADAYGDEGAPR
ncbi:GvpL/GvpF family gas vesicle protein [Streptomyces sp. NPDC053755]|uniref:GvpL/GvpF family gas vesicle protein n=1 Tax=Streptomyces sp. NPDC053755 TaxID=3155815 RepID=UPI003434F034